MQHQSSLLSSRHWSNHGPRRSFNSPSIHHQTLVGKALYEQSVNIQTIAAAAVSSSKFRNSSLGPNLLSLIQIDENTADLFAKVFYSSSPSCTLQFTHSVQATSCYHVLLQKLINSGKYFSSSLKHLHLYNPNSSLSSDVEIYRSLSASSRQSALESISLSGPDFDFELFRFLFLSLDDGGDGTSSPSSCFPNLKELIFRGSAFYDCDEYFFKTLGNLFTRFPLLESLTIQIGGLGKFDQPAFRKYFVVGILAKNRLRKLEFRLGFPQIFSDETISLMNDKIQIPPLTNLEEYIGYMLQSSSSSSSFESQVSTFFAPLAHTISSSSLTSSSSNLRKLILVSGETTLHITDEHLVTFGESCPYLQELELSECIRVTGSFLKRENDQDEEGDSFKFLQSLSLVACENFHLGTKSPNETDHDHDSRILPSSSFLFLPSLKTLRIEDAPNFTGGGGLLKNLFRKSNNKLETLEIIETRLNDDALSEIYCPSSTSVLLKTLDLSENRHITEHGLKSFVSSCMVSGGSLLLLEDLSLLYCMEMKSITWLIEILRNNNNRFRKIDLRSSLASCYCYFDEVRTILELCPISLEEIKFNDGEEEDEEDDDDKNFDAFLTKVLRRKYSPKVRICGHFDWRNKDKDAFEKQKNGLLNVANAGSRRERSL